MKIGKKSSTLGSFGDGSIEVETLSRDIKSKDFLGFRIINLNSRQEIVRLRAPNVAVMRQVMVSLACEREGLFCKKVDQPDSSSGFVQEQWNVNDFSEDELCDRDRIFDSQINNRTEFEVSAPLSYEAAIQKLPINFYFHEVFDFSSQAERSQLEATISLFDPDVPVPIFQRRPWHDTFKPPRGPPIITPVSIGYGSEVGLPPGMQALWDFITKSYFFLDHINKISFLDDPRSPLEPKPYVQKISIAYGDRKRESNISARACYEDEVIEATSIRALSRPRGVVVQACGVNGKSGGVIGEKGVRGNRGIFGRRGESYGKNGGVGCTGGTGGRGKIGESGANGTEASDVIVSLSGNANELTVSGTCDLVANLGGVRAEEIVLFNCRGGDGGEGGRGGGGGRGGCGGDGGQGSDGKPGLDRRGPGDNGGPGGDGGPGGTGGEGGPGGRGGNGGNAGYGGVCVFQSCDPSLFMLLDADCMCGTPGVAGEGGLGGSGGDEGVGGRCGLGGRGGRGGSYTNDEGHRVKNPNGIRGKNGVKGSHGITGPNGPNGSSGTDGNPAKKGGILWVVNGSDGEILHQSATRYDAEITTFKIASAVDDGIFEPNEKITISDVIVTNSGGLPLPENASLFMPSTPTVKFEPTQYNLPSQNLHPGDIHAVPIQFCGRIFDQPPPNAPGPFVSTAKFCPRTELLGRPFEKSSLSKELIVQYPVKLKYLKCSESLGRGEVSVFEIGVQNVSSMPYGDCPGSGGKVSLRIHFDARLIPVGSAKVGLDSVPYTVTHDPNTKDSTYIYLKEIPPNQTVSVQIHVQIESHAGLFERCYWQTDLYLRDKLIEYNYDKIRVTPLFRPRDPVADILLITSDKITRKQFVFWQKILDVLNLSVDFWDITLYHGLSVDRTTNRSHSVSWEGQYVGKMILYPHCELDLLLNTDIARHFHGIDYRHNVIKELQSSMLLFLPESLTRGRTSECFHDRGDGQVLRHLSTTDPTAPLPRTIIYGGKHICQPGTCFSTPKPFQDWEKDYLHKIEEENPRQCPVVLSRVTDIRKIGKFAYHYGSVDMRYLPILRSSKFIVADGSSGNFADMTSDDVNLVSTSTEIPLGSKYGQVFLLTLYCIPLERKVDLLKSEHQQNPSRSLIQMTFSLPNGVSLSLAELAMITMADEVADEIYTCTGSSERLQVLASSIEQDCNAFVGNGLTILRGLKLIQDTIKGRKIRLKHSSVSPFVLNVKRLCNYIQRQLQEVGMTRNHLEPLIPFQLLVNSDHIHRSHQHWVEDGCWNLQEY